MKTNFANWKQKLETICLARYCVDLNDLGASDEVLQADWLTGDRPQDIASYYEDKYDLIHIKDWRLG